MKYILLFVLLSLSFVSFSQEDAWVYFTDKENVAASIANPISILTQEALNRKSAHSVIIDERDVPINENYISQLKSQTGITVFAKSKWFNAVHVRGLEADINTLLNLSFVQSITFADGNLNARILNNESSNNKFRVNDTQIQFNYGNSDNQIQMISGDDLHLANYTGEGITVAVLDAGFPGVDVIDGFQRLRDAGKLLGAYDFVNRDNDVYTNTTSSHGTLVLSDMAGFIQDEFVGTAPDASYYLFVTEEATYENPVEESFWVEAVERADSLGVDIINTSLGYKVYDNPNYSHTDNDLDGLTTYISKGANIALEKGMLLVNSAGNSGASGITAPADAAGVLSVGAVKDDGTYASFSSQGSVIQLTQKPDVVAQGQASLVITQDNTLANVNGTSFSSPILAGGIASLWQALPSLTNTQIMQLVRESASQFNNPDYFLGYGIPDLSLALSQGLSIVEFQNYSSILQVFPNPVTDELNVKLPSNQEFARLLLYDILGKKILETQVTRDQSKLNLSAFANGMYLLKIEAEGLSKSLKLVINAK